MPSQAKNHLEMGRSRSPHRVRAVVLPVCVGTGLSLIGDSALYTILPLNLGVVGITLTSVGIVLSINRIVRLFINTPMGILYDRWPRRRLFLPSLYLGALSTAIYALTTGIWPLLLGRVLWGIAWTGIWVGGNSIILDISADSDRGRWVGVYQAAFFLGAAGGALLGGLLSDLMGFRWTMGVGAGLTFLGAVFASVVLRETRLIAGVEHQPHPNVVLPPGAVMTPPHPGELSTANVLLGVNRLVVAGIIPATLGLYLGEQLGDPITIGGSTMGVATLTGLGLGMSTLISTGAVPVVGRLSDRARTRWQVVSLGVLSGVVGFGLLAMGSSWSILAGLIFIAFTSASNTSQSTTLVGDLSGIADRSRRLGMLYTVGDLGSAIGPPLAFFVLPFMGIRGLYLVMASVLIGMLVLSLSWSRKKQAALQG